MSDKIPHKESFYIEGILNDDRFVVKRIYDEFFPKIKRMVTANSGNADDAWDVFQDALVVIYKKALKPDFILTCPFYNFLYPICKNLWLRKLNKKSRTEVTIQDEDGYVDEVNIEDVIHQTERHALYKEKFALLGEKCQQLMQLVFNKKKMREIAKILNYNNEQTTKQQHYKCKKKLIKFVREDGRFDELKGF